MHAKTAFVLLMGVVAAVGCSSKAGGESVGQSRALLHRAQSCPDLLRLLQEDARAKVNEYFDRQIRQVREYQNVYGDKAVPGGSFAAGSAESGAARNTSAAPTAAPADSQSAGASSYSDTNVQVRGVDEADFVKTNGKYIYLLHGKTFTILNAWPAAELASAASIDIEGAPQEMFVSDNAAVIYSTVDGRKVLEKAGVTPRAEYTDGWGYGGGIAMGRAEPAVSVAPMPDGGGSYVPAIPLTKVTFLSLNQANQPTVTRQVYFEGTYTTSRRVGTDVRTILQGGAHGPSIRTWFEYQPGQTSPQTVNDMVSAYEQLRQENLARVSASKIEDWVPYTFTKSGDNVTKDTIRCEDFYVPTSGSTEYGITQVHAVDMANAGDPLRSTAIVGQVDTVYASANAMYLAARSWRNDPIVMDMPVASSGGGVAVSEPPPSGSPGTPTKQSVLVWDRRAPITLNSTHVHKLEFGNTAKFPNYVASGTVPGNVVDQFSLDEKDNVLRISTTEQRLVPNISSTTYNHVLTLGQNGDSLDKLGGVMDLSPGERIYSTRFIGNKGYVVTFRQIDPLHVIELGDPRNVRETGQLKIEGFSTYLHPLGEGYLLAIGRESGKLMLQIFDVRDPAKPTRVHQTIYDSQQMYGYSDAEQDHKAFTFFDDKGLLAFPFMGSGPSGTKSTLEVYKVDVAAGFTKLASIDHTDFYTARPQGYCGYSPTVRRGMFLENFVYSISFGGVKVNDVNNIGPNVASLALPVPAVPSYWMGGRAAMPDCVVAE